MNAIRRIAMWSGPRNLSSAMMRSFGSRSDCQVWDEPFYAAYLARTGIDHPMRQETLATCEQDAEKVVDGLLGPLRDGLSVHYQKHMTHHMVPGMPRDWMAHVQNVFLIRHPARVLASYSAKREEPVLSDLGFVEQAELFDHVRAMGQSPIVVDAADIRENPERMLKKLCEALDLRFDAGMLSWPSGAHPDDGVWALHWYASLWASTGFAGPETGPPPESDRTDILEPAMAIYERMHAQRLS